MTRSTPASTRTLAGLVALALACVAPQRADDVVVVASGADLESANPLVTMHPMARQVQRHVLFVTLARYDSELRPVPYAARDWQWTADRRELSLRLEPSLRWHDGVPTTAHDVAFTLAAAADPQTGYPWSADLQGVDVRVEDDSIVRLRFASPQVDIPGWLVELPMVPRHLLESVPRRALRTAAFNIAPVGNGPFRFVERRAGERWRFARNESFPESLGGPPPLAGFVVAVVDEATTKYAALSSGELEMAGISPTMAALANRDPAIRVVDYPVLFTTGLVYNTTRPPFDRREVREAVAISLDRDRIIAAALAGYALPASGAVSPANPLAVQRPVVHDERRADSLLDAAGWARGAGGTRQRDGRQLRLELLTVGSADNAIEQLIQDDLARRGIRVDIRQLELGAFLTAARAEDKRFDMLVTGIPGDLALSYIPAMFESAQGGGALAYSGFTDPRLDALFAGIRRSTDVEQLRRSWREVQEILASEVPVAWLYHSRGVQGVSARLRNVELDLRGELATVARWQLLPRGR
jgi:peptide/nickel transport system substrate-binding protein